jgi:hypothetical protein
MEQQDLQTIIEHVSKNVKWVIPDSIRTDHATHMVVQQQGSEFTFLFFETASPLFMGSVEEQIAAYNALNYVEAKCVAKVIMSAENATLAANNLISSLNRYHSGQLAPKGQADAETDPEYTDN